MNTGCTAPADRTPKGIGGPRCGETAIVCSLPSGRYCRPCMELLHENFEGSLLYHLLKMRAGKEPRNPFVENVAVRGENL